MSQKLIDISHVIENGMQTYPGLPVPVITDYLSHKDAVGRYAEGTTFQLGKIEMVVNTGTYIDAPSHRYEGEADIADLPLNAVANIPGLVVRVDEQTKAIDASHFQHVDVRDKAVLVHTGWDKHWRTEKYFSDHPYLTEGAAVYLRDHGAKLAGIDSLNIDGMATGARPVHTVLLAAGIPVVEHLCNLGDVPELGFRFFAVPARVRGAGSFPVRALALVE